MVTLTHWRRVDPYYFHSYFSSVGRVLDIPGFAYCMSVERHADGTWHSHGILAADSPYKTGYSIQAPNDWRSRLHRLDSGMVRGTEWALKRSHNFAYALALHWRVTRGGISAVHEIRDREAAIGYALKYALKYMDTGEWFIGETPKQRHE